MIHSKYLQLAPGQVRFATIEGRIIGVIPNYTELHDTPQPIVDGNCSNYLVEVPDDQYYEVNGQGMVNIGPKGNWGSRHEYGQFPIQSLVMIKIPVLPGDVV